jgi:hypothetical protein
MASYDREWLPTCTFAGTLGRGELVGEFPLWTGARGEIRRRVDGILIRNSQASQPLRSRQWQDLSDHEKSAWTEQMQGGDLVVVQTKLTVIGLAVLGQALMSDLLIRDRFGPTRLETVALCTGPDPVLEEVLAQSATWNHVRVEVIPELVAKPPRIEPTREPDMRRAFAAKRLPGWTCLEKFPLTRFQRAEALYVRDADGMQTADDLSGRDIVFINSSERLHLDLLGHVVLSPAIVNHLARPSSVRSLALVRHDDPALSAYAPKFDDVEIEVVGSGL